MDTESVESALGQGRVAERARPSARPPADRPEDAGQQGRETGTGEEAVQAGSGVAVEVGPGIREPESALSETAAAAAISLPRMAELRDVLDIALRAGQLLLENGAETWRVEETVHRLGTALGAEWLDIYVTPTGIIISTIAAHEHRTRIRRVVGLGVDLSKVGALVELSRRAVAGQATRADVRERLEQIAAAQRAYPLWLVVLLVAIACAGFAALSGAGLAEFVLTVLAAGLGMIVRLWLNRIFASPLLTTVISALVAVTTAILSSRLIACPRPDLVIISSVLFLLPGVPMINAIGDLINGDLVSGLARGAQAALVLAALALGMVLGLALLGGRL